MEFDEIKEVDNEYQLKVFKRQNICFDRGEGSTLYDTNGKAYTDFFAGIAVSSLGYNHPELTKAISSQAGKILHTSNLYYSEARSRFLKLLLSGSIFSRAFLSNSGAEANECAIKLARKYYYNKGESRPVIITANGSFHGRTLAAVTATGQEKYNKPYAPLPAGFKYVPYNDFAALKEAMTDDVGAIMLECIQCESGVTPANYDYLVNAYALAKSRDVLVILDEVQTGAGRTGKLYCFEHFGIMPDIATLAKGIAGGVPMGVTLARGEAANAMDYGDHGSTFGGDPLACAAGSVVLEALQSGLLSEIEEKGEYMTDALTSRLARHKFVKDIRGKGLMKGIELDERLAVAEIVGKMANLGIIIGSAGKNTIRICPPYIITKAEIDNMAEKLESIFANTNI